MFQGFRSSLRFLSGVPVLARSRDGNVAIMTAFALMLLVPLAGGAVEIQHQSALKLEMQDAMDAAVLAGIRAGNGYNTAASTYFEASLPDHEGIRVTSAFSGGPASVTGTAQGVYDTSFLKMLGIPSLTIHATATAVQSQSATCVLVLDDTASQAFLANSKAQVEAPECEFHVKSTARPAAILNKGVDLDVSRLCIEGDNIIDNGATVTRLEKSCQTVSDPYAGNLPTPATGCQFNGRNYDGNVSMTPGVYCGHFNFNNCVKVTFAPGVYVIKDGGWNVNGGKWEGKGVTFYFADTSKIQFNSDIDADLSAPTTGTYQGLLFYEADGLSQSNFIFNDSHANGLDGLIYLPSRNVIFNSGSKAKGHRLTIVVKSLILNDTRWTLEAPTTPVAGVAALAGGSGSPYLAR